MDQGDTFMINKIRVLVIAAALIMLAAAQCVRADDGTWNVTTSGAWSLPDNWAGSTVADGDGFTAWFTVDVPSASVISVNVDAARTIGNLYFYEADTSTLGSYLISGSNTLSLSNSASTGATITVTPQDVSLPVAEISAPMEALAGTNLNITTDTSVGAGTGALTLSGATTVPSGNATIQGGTTVNLSGSLAVSNGATTLQSGTINVTGGLSTAGASIWGGQNLNISGAGTVTGTGQIYIGGTVNVGRSGFDDTAKLICNSTATDGSAALDFGRYGDAAVINAYGHSTISTTGADPAANQVLLAGWGYAPENATLNMYDHSELDTASLVLSLYGLQGHVNLNDHATVNAANVTLCPYAVNSAQNATFTMNGYSTVNVTGTFSVNEHGAVTDAVSTLEMFDNSILNTATLKAGQYGANTGYIKLHNHAQVIATTVETNAYTSGAAEHIIMDGSSSITATNLFLDENGPVNGSSATLTMSGTSVITLSGTMAMNRWGYCTNAQADLSESAQINANVLLMNDYTALDNAGCVSKITLNNSSKLNINTYANVANSIGSGTMIVNDTAEVHVTGALSSAGWNRGVDATVPTSGQVDVNVSGKIFAGSINMGGGSATAPNNSTSLWNVTDTGTVTDNGNLSMGGGTSIATLNVKKSAKFIVGGALNMGDVAGGLGTINVTENASFTVAGATTLTDGSSIILDSTGTLSLKAVAGGAADSLVVGDGNTGVTHYAATAYVDSVSIGTVTLGAGSTLVINAIPGGPSAGGGLTPVPEPSTFVLLTIAALGFIGAAWRKRK
jgi:fibronectin-binding autotransporter adhesin